MHDAAPTSENLPLAQLVQADAPAAENLPALHSSQMPAP